MKKEKTNAVRIMDRLGIAYTARSYPCPEALSATAIAEKLGADPSRVFKTLVTRGRSGSHYVFMIPAREELDLRKAASVTGEKSISMIRERELLPLTGYVHGGCSPVGMKKQFPTYIHRTAEDCELIIFSGGRIGLQTECSLEELRKAQPVTAADITAD
ncbi:MAG: Cys-tRNA(Pro) deacylase [Abditibacteriota bacterium]|nr:Cys-tRNA(Pro) deacylase [Abditibacteriota bacterium]